jgi:hypothetical protein
VLECPAGISILLRSLGLRPIRRHAAFPNGGFLAGELLARCCNQGGIDDLSAHGEKALGRQHLVKAPEQPLDSTGPLELSAMEKLVFRRSYVKSCNA